MKKRMRTYQNMMSGVSQMLPFVVAGGFFIALSFMFDASNAGAIDFGSGTIISAWLNDTGHLIMGFMLPILGGFIAYSISDRPGLVPGFLAGALASTQNSGFIGALMGGFFAGYLMLMLIKLFSKFPPSFNSIKSIFFLPILGAFISALMMIAINYIIGPVQTNLELFFEGLSGPLAIIICLIAGALMAIDMGGPINKIAYLFGIVSITGGISSILMAAVMAAGMTPPLGIALSTLVFKKKFSEEEIKLGKNNWIMGATFVTEGAIPFVQKKPKAVLPAIIIGSALAGALIGFFETSVMTPHGGVFVIFMMENWLGFIISILSGMVVTTIILRVLLFRNKNQK